MRPLSARDMATASLSTAVTSEILRSSRTSIEKDVQSLCCPRPPPSAGLRPRLVVRHRVKGVDFREADDNDDERLRPSSSGFAVFSDTASSHSMSSATPSPAAHNAGSSISLKTLLAARRVAALAKGRRHGTGGVGAPTRHYPFRPKRSQYLWNATHGVAPSPLHITLDVGSEEEDEEAVMRELVAQLRSRLDTLGQNLNSVVERAEEQLFVFDNAPVVAAKPAGSDAAATVSSHASSKCLLASQRRSCASLRRDNTLQHQRVLSELHDLIPKKLPVIQLCYWDFSVADGLEDELAACFALLSEAILGAHEVLRLAGFQYQQRDPQLSTAHSRRCEVEWSMMHCTLRGTSFIKLPLMFGAPSVCKPSSLQQSQVMLNSFSGMLTPSFLSPRVASDHDAFCLTGIDVSHCHWRESARCGLQAVLRESGWGLRRLELRGADLQRDLVIAVNEMLRARTHESRAATGSKQLTFANCSGWSTASSTASRLHDSSDVSVQRLLISGLKNALCDISNVTLQGVPLPPDAGIALLDAISANPRIRNVALESCHFVTPRFLRNLSEAIRDRPAAAAVADTPSKSPLPRDCKNGN